MAIKGKSGSRGRRRSGGAPRAVPVEVRTPLLARRGFWTAAAVVGSAALAVALWVAAGQSISSARARTLDRKEAVVTKAVASDLQTALGDLQWVGEPDLLGLPKAFTQALDAAVDPGSIASASSAGNQLLPLLASARAALDAVDVPTRVRDKGFDELFTLRLIQARQRFIDGLEIYRVAATLAAQAGALTGDAQAAAIASAKDLAAQGAAAVSDAYQNLVEAEVMAGTYKGPAQTPANLGG